MGIIIALIIISLGIALIFLFIFLWSLRSGQYDDVHTPSMRILFDTNQPESKQKDQKNQYSQNSQSKN